MKAAICRRYGPPENVRIEDVPTPQPKAGEVLVRVRAASVSAGDWRVRSLDVPAGFGAISRLALGFRGPRQPVLGGDLAGEVVALGAGVTGYAVGDRVAAFPSFAMGCHAEFRAVATTGRIARLPPSVSFAQGAALAFGGMTALIFLEKAGLRPGMRLRVIGASGSVGSAAVAIGRHLGAEVTAVCGPAHREWIAELGASRVVDYTAEPAWPGDSSADLVLDAVGDRPLAEAWPTLRPGGALLRVVAGFGEMLTGWRRGPQGRRLVVGTGGESVERYRRLVEWAGQGAVLPVIGDTLPFEGIVEAHRRVESRRKKANLILTFDG